MFLKNMRVEMKKEHGRLRREKNARLLLLILRKVKVEMIQQHQNHFLYEEKSSVRIRNIKSFVLHVRNVQRAMCLRS